MKELRRDVQTPPKLSLANNLWVGKIPWELQRLTLPEQLLIAHLYPRVYIFKLFPKTFAARSDGTTLQRGMRGNVSTFMLNVDDVAAMIKGDLMPRPPAILASIISVTFIGVGSYSPEALRTIFRVRRQAVLEALLWLKENNKKYYGSIKIDTEQLQNLPEDDVPPEILDILRQSDDIDVVDQENGGYVRTETGSYGECRKLSGVWSNILNPPFRCSE